MIFELAQLVGNLSTEKYHSSALYSASDMYFLLRVRSIEFSRIQVRSKVRTNLGSCGGVELADVALRDFVRYYLCIVH